MYSPRDLVIIHRSVCGGGGVILWGPLMESPTVQRNKNLLQEYFSISPKLLEVLTIIWLPELITCVVLKTSYQLRKLKLIKMTNVGALINLIKLRGTNPKNFI